MRVIVHQTYNIQNDANNQEQKILETFPRSFTFGPYDSVNSNNNKVMLNNNQSVRNIITHEELTEPRIVTTVHSDVDSFIKSEKLTYVLAHNRNAAKVTRR